MTTKQRTIAVDIDDVLSATVEGIVSFSNERWGMQLTMEDYTEEFAVFWGVPLQEAHKRIDEMLSSGLFSRHRHFEDAVPVLTSLKQQGYNLVAVTSRRSILKPDTDKWLKRYFPGIFKEVRYMGLWDGQHDVQKALKQTKAEICRELGAEYLIDDQLKHCVGAAAAGVTSFLFGEYKWNSTADELPANLIRVNGWDDIGRYFDAGR
jgi:uncharacterized HAD superfamily protein